MTVEYGAETAIELQREREQIAFQRVDFIAKTAVRTAYIEGLGVNPAEVDDYDTSMLREMLASKFSKEEGIN
jgi:hypothetical protein